MKKTARDPSFLSNVLNIFSRKPVATTMKTAQQASAHGLVKRDKQKSSGVNYPYRAAEVVAMSCACDAVRVVAGTRFLMRDVPRIPLPECTSRKCTCTYLRHLDRRNPQGDRRAEFSALTNAYEIIGNEERRRKGGRRTADMASS